MVESKDAKLEIFEITVTQLATLQNGSKVT